MVFQMILIRIALLVSRKKVARFLLSVGSPLTQLRGFIPSKVVMGYTRKRNLWIKEELGHSQKFQLS